MCRSGYAASSTWRPSTPLLRGSACASSTGPSTLTPSATATKVSRLVRLCRAAQSPAALLRPRRRRRIQGAASCTPARCKARHSGRHGSGPGFPAVVYISHLSTLSPLAANPSLCDLQLPVAVLCVPGRRVCHCARPDRCATAAPGTSGGRAAPMAAALCLTSDPSPLPSPPPFPHPWQAAHTSRPSGCARAASSPFPTASRSCSPASAAHCSFASSSLSPRR